MKILVGIVIFLIAANIDQACVVNDKVYKDGDTWTQKNFELTCEVSPDGSWRTKITACLAPGGFRLHVGSVFIEGGRNYTCMKKPGGRVEFAYRPV
ncbi:Uncharacterized protein ACO02O_10385 [Dirofilaria immitis]